MSIFWKEKHCERIRGAKKQAESTKQLFKVFKVFKKKLGTIHVRISQPIIADKVEDSKKDIQRVAFECLNSIAKEMPVTPSSLLSMVMLDELAGAMPWKQVKNNVSKSLNTVIILIFITPSLYADEAEISLRKALDMYVLNKKIDATKERLERSFTASKMSVV